MSFKKFIFHFTHFLYNIFLRDLKYLDSSSINGIFGIVQIKSNIGEKRHIINILITSFDEGDT